MTLVIGGYGAGKLEYVKRGLGYSDSDISESPFDSCKAAVNVHNLLRPGADEIPGLLEMLLQKEVVICDEVGCGVVPADKAERDYRESVGRLCSELARRAGKVVRVYCGIPTVIKG